MSFRRNDDGSESWMNQYYNLRKQGGHIPSVNVDHNQIARAREAGVSDPQIKKLVDAYMNAPHFDPIPVKFEDSFIDGMENRLMNYAQNAYREHGRPPSETPVHQPIQQTQQFQQQAAQSVRLNEGAPLFKPLQANGFGMDISLARYVGNANQEISMREAYLKKGAKVYVVEPQAQTINLQEIQRNPQVLKEMILVQIPMVGEFFVMKEAIAQKYRQQQGQVLPNNNVNVGNRQMLRETPYHVPHYGTQQTASPSRVVLPQNVFANRGGGKILKG